MMKNCSKENESLKSSDDDLDISKVDIKDEPLL